MLKFFKDNFGFNPLWAVLVVIVLNGLFLAGGIWVVVTVLRMMGVI